MVHIKEEMEEKQATKTARHLRPVESLPAQPGCFSMASNLAESACISGCSGRQLQ